MYIRNDGRVERKKKGKEGKREGREKEESQVSKVLDHIFPTHSIISELNPNSMYL